MNVAVYFYIYDIYRYFLFLYKWFIYIYVCIGICTYINIQRRRASALDVVVNGKQHQEQTVGGTLHSRLPHFGRSSSAIHYIHTHINTLWPRPHQVSVLREYEIGICIYIYGMSYSSTMFAYSLEAKRGCCCEHHPYYSRLCQIRKFLNLLRRNTKSRGRERRVCFDY